MRYILLLFLATLMVSCGDSFKRTSFLNEYENFVESLAKNGASYDEKKWQEAEEKFRQYSEMEYPKFKEGFTPEERTKYNSLTGRYYGLLAKHKASSISRELEGLLEQTKGVLNELQK
ncbi:MAG: hypothetical protein IPN29_18885 [Saprospiraceae bacterium]|nr:hypothetical protein [Saprospiraceae bacterium]